MNTAKEQYEVLDGMASKMSELFSDIAKYFAFDPKKYTMEEFFADLKKFCQQFTVSRNKFKTSKIINVVDDVGPHEVKITAISY